MNDIFFFLEYGTFGVSPVHALKICVDIVFISKLVSLKKYTGKIFTSAYVYFLLFVHYFLRLIQTHWKLFIFCFHHVGARCQNSLLTLANHLTSTPPITSKKPMVQCCAFRAVSLVYHLVKFIVVIFSVDKFLSLRNYVDLEMFCLFIFVFVFA